MQQIATKYHRIFVKYDTKSRSVLEQTLYQKKKKNTSLIWKKIWVKVIKNGPSKTCGRQPLKILLGPFLNTMTHFTCFWIFLFRATLFRPLYFHILVFCTTILKYFLLHSFVLFYFTISCFALFLLQYLILPNVSFHTLHLPTPLFHTSLYRTSYFPISLVNSFILH